MTKETKKVNSVKKLKDKLFFTKKSVWDGIDTKGEKEIFSFCEGYKEFLNNCKTERETIRNVQRMSAKSGFKNIDRATKADKKIFINNRGVSSVLAYIGHNNFEKGFNIITSHVDSPQLDLKGVPLYEAEDMAFMKTCYYGGIKKYQWVTVPLSMHGVIVKKDGRMVDVVIGEDDEDPVFTVNDLLIHLAQDQITKPADKVIEGEQLNILVGSIPYKFKSENDAIKLNILDYLSKKYGITEEDLVSSELHLVPATKARDVGFDRSFIGAHGQDDSVCVYSSIKALFDVGGSNKNFLAIFFDKEEIGSFGDSGADSNFLIRIVRQLMDLYGVSSGRTILKALENSKAISGDVTAGIDPEWKGVIEPMNAAKMGSGVTIVKYGAGRGKAGSGEAHAEFVAEIRSAFDKDKVKWQVAELGKVDQGGGGTVAKYLSYFGMDVIDCGPALLSMHSPFEIVSKADVFSTYKAYRAFYKYC